MAWRRAHSLDTFVAEVNGRWPGRDKHSDGSIGNAAHAATASDHNPNAQGVVCAFDLDVDLDGTDDGLDDRDIDLIAETIRSRRDPRVAFMILKRRICRGYDKPGIPAWTWSPYGGADDHTSHLHLSVGQGSEGNRNGNYDDPTPWGITNAVPGPGNVPVPPLEDDMYGPDQRNEVMTSLDQLTYAVSKLLLPAVGRLELDASTSDHDPAEIAKLVLAGLDPKAVAAAIPTTIASQVADELKKRLDS
jgi:hypothetical protein